jgi:two-component system, LuxR family, response regulator FixJ
LSPDSPVIYLVDDDASFLTATARLLRASGFAVKPFPSAEEFLKNFVPDSHGCVIADLNMPHMNGLELQSAMIHAGHAMPVVFLTGHGNIETSVLAMRHGAEDFITKRATKEALLNAIQRALTRDGRLRELRAPFAVLTPRDREVLAHVLKGRLNKQIATDLGIDERSVKRHRTSIMAKLRVDSVAELTRLVDDAGLTFDVTDHSSSPPPVSSLATPRP